MKKVFSILLPCIAMVFLFTSCSKDDVNPISPSLDRTEVTLYVDETINLTYSGSDCTWSSDNPFIASVKDGTITANLVGETVIHANDANCKITVKPHYTKYYDPYIKWNEEKNEVKKYMRDYEIQQEEDDQITYKGDTSIPYYVYTFKDGKLISSGLLVNILDGIYLTSYLLERYIPLSKDDTMYYFTSPDKETLIAMKIESNAILVVYTALNPTSKSHTTYIKNILSEFNKITQK